MGADVLSDVLQAVRLTGAVFYWVEAAGSWVAAAPSAREIASETLPGSEHVMEFHVLVEGSCWVGIAGEAPQRLQAGQVVVFPHGDAHVLRSAPGMPAGPELRPPPRPPGMPFAIRLGHPRAVPDTRFACGFLGCDASPFNPLLAALPRMLCVSSGAGPLGDLVRLAAAETETPRPGGEALRARLAEMMFVEVVRTYLSELPARAGGWLDGLRDPHVGRALALLHERPAEPWTLEGLAREVGLSRTPLQERFATLLGQSPMQYLACWRMQLAALRLTGGMEKVAAIALEVGYESEAAFNRAFKRALGMPPAAWRKAQATARAVRPVA